MAVRCVGNGQGQWKHLGRRILFTGGAGRTASCLSNLRQLNTATMLYMQASKNHCFPYYGGSTQILWQAIILPYLAPRAAKYDIYTNDATTAAEIKKMQLGETAYFCPTARDSLNVRS